MNKTVIFLTLVTLLSFSPSLSQAQGRPLQVKPDTARKAQALDEVQVKKANRMQEVVARLSSKLDQRVARYEEFVEKIKARRSDIAPLNLDTTELDRLIRVAEADLVQAKADLNESKTNLENLDYSLNVREIRALIQTEISGAREIFRTLHPSIVAVVVEFGTLSTSQE